MIHSKIPGIHHKDHVEWLKEIDFYQNQILIFQKELSTVLLRHPELFSIIEHVDEYRSIMMNKLSKLDEIRRQIILHERQISKTLKIGAIEIWDHVEVSNSMKHFRSAYEKFRNNIRGFIAHNMHA